MSWTENFKGKTNQLKRSKHYSNLLFFFLPQCFRASFAWIAMPRLALSLNLTLIVHASSDTVIGNQGEGKEGERVVDLCAYLQL